jgi:hypothetical protein
VEARLQEMEGKYHSLTQSYEALQSEYILAKGQLDRLMREEQKERDGKSGAYSGQIAGLDSCLFEEEVFCFEGVGN